jgi:threonine dehydratase
VFSHSSGNHAQGVTYAAKAIITVTEDETRHSMKRLLFSARIPAEPRGAVTTSAALFPAEIPASNKMVAVVAGRNVEPEPPSDIVISHSVR